MANHHKHGTVVSGAEGSVARWLSALEDWIVGGCNSAEGSVLYCALPPYPPLTGPQVVEAVERGVMRYQIELAYKLSREVAK